MNTVWIVEADGQFPGFERNFSNSLRSFEFDDWAINESKLIKKVKINEYFVD